MGAFIVRVGGAAGLVLLVAACHHPEVRLTGDRPVPGGVVTNPDVRILAVDRSFELDGGQPFDTPFQSDLWGRAFDGFFANPAGYYGQALEHGARRVVVYAGGDVTPLYGVLAFNPASQYSEGPDAQSYRLSLSDDDLARARNGEIAVVYERVPWTHGEVSHAWIGSVLWLSSVPLQ
jgi:hypothetical protein